MSAVELANGTLSADDIRAVTPHRHPFVMLDRITALVPGRRGTGVKNVTVAEPCFAGHFPQEYVFPGVLLVEALAQLAGVVHGAAQWSERPAGAPPMIGYLAAIRSFKFTHPVRPGDRVVLDAEAGPAMGALSDFTVTATVDGRTVATGRLAIADMTGEGGDE
jgi:3-hydroxyacyl-[acyl-carrier-protein] dehydratase